ncbi:Uncharacterised protein [Legionella quateirensis]|uniref:Uncharacterized protein n=1 Tax=Legionella quateirensis TaxID=45072 RepID=A0A378KYE2_9GAMM|nr:Uncharacterised protein [Legionella quateirensis]
MGCAIDFNNGLSLFYAIYVRIGDTILNQMSDLDSVFLYSSSPSSALR